MLGTTRIFNNLKLLSDFIANTPDSIILASSRTSTVINFDELSQNIELIDLSQMPSRVEILSNGNLFIEGAVTWRDARLFCRSQGLDILTSPTEEDACVLAGIATSATGERAFGFGTLRELVVQISYLDSFGKLKSLSSRKLLKDHAFFEKEPDLLYLYQNDFKKFEGFKNAPFPRMEKETDLMVGTEGQLGIILNAEIKVQKLEDYQYFLIKLPKFERTIHSHLEIFKKVQKFRHSISSCEFIDSHSLETDYDGIYIEVKSSEFEIVYNEFLCRLNLISEDDIFELTRSKYEEIRISVPRKINDFIAINQLKKKGTDAQALEIVDFEILLKTYQRMSQNNIKYVLFGHFGDGHLHFNFLPEKSQLLECDQHLLDFYQHILEYNISPFAEHGIGVLKQKFIRPFLNDKQLNLFHFLKNKMDNKNIFFPNGFMNLKAARHES